MNRRGFLGTASVVLTAWSGADARTRAAAFDYDQACVIDAQGTIDDPAPGELPESPPSTQLLQDLASSGITAVSVTLNVGTSGDLFAKTVARIASFDEKAAAAVNVLTRIRTYADLRRAQQTRHLGLIYNVQNTLWLESDVSRVATLQALGLRQVQLTYNVRNSVGDGCLEPSDAGLSRLGHDLVAELAQRRLVMDLSHAGKTTTAQAIALASRPPVISHTGCRDLNDNPRNVFDTELRALADKGGVVGIYFMPFLVKTGTAHAADLIRHLEHAVNVCGEDHVGLGTDGSVSAITLDAEYREGLRRKAAARLARGVAAPGEGADAYELIPEYNGPGKFRRLADDLAHAGWPARRIEKVLGANFARVYREVWGD
jgi:membrane dipeptidase